MSRRVNKGKKKKKKALNVTTAHYEPTTGELKVTAGVGAARGRNNSRCIICCHAGQNGCTQICLPHSNYYYYYYYF